MMVARGDAPGLGASSRSITREHDADHGRLCEMAGDSVKSHQLAPHFTSRSEKGVLARLHKIEKSQRFCPRTVPAVSPALWTGSATAVAVIAEGDLTQVVKDLRTYETTYGLPQVPVLVPDALLSWGSPDGPIANL
jgi:hypothetical protein